MLFVQCENLILPDNHHSTIISSFTSGLPDSAGEKGYRVTQYACPLGDIQVCHCSGKPGRRKKGREEISFARCLLLEMPFQDLFLLHSRERLFHGSKNCLILLAFLREDPSSFLSVDCRVKVDVSRVGHLEPNQI